VSFTMCDRRHLSDKDIPPDEDQCDQAGHELVAIVILGGEAAPGPVIFQVGKGIFAVSAVAVDSAPSSGVSPPGKALIESRHRGP
jgi:hypothetical protein